MEEELKYNFPTEKVFLPSKGKPYPLENLLSQGFIDMRYMCTREEDILTSRSLVEKNLVLDTLLKSLIVSKIDYDSMLIGDKEALLIAARVLGYGRAYKTEMTCPKCNDFQKDYEFDLSLIEHKNIEGLDTWEQGKREFEFKYPDKELTIIYKLINNGEERTISDDLKGLEKITVKTNVSYSMSTPMKHAVVSINGNVDKKFINDFIDNKLLAMDARILRKEIQSHTPGPETKIPYICPSCGYQEEVRMPLKPEFFWPGD